MSEPLVIEFLVDAEPDHAFETWTERCGAWWPADHTVSRGPAEIVFEPHAGGRIYERATTGAEHEWGTVVAWEPPDRLSLRWHLFFDPAEATDVEITFRARGPGTTVRIEQRGWERLGDAAPARRERTGRVWASMGTLFAAACAGEMPAARDSRRR